MIDLSTQYAGLTLKNPIIVGSSALTGSIANIIKAEQAGAAAVVLKSIFEEEITNEYSKILAESDTWNRHDVDLDYFDYKIKENNIEKYIQLIKDAKAAVSIPVIASVNCISAHEWTFFAREIEKAGADAIELNIFISPADTGKSSESKELLYFDIIKAVQTKVKIPITLKMSYFFTDLSGMIQSLSKTAIQGIVLFNRFFSPDIDIEKRQIIPANIFSTPSELSTSLRWVAISANKISCDIAASTGIHDGKALVKQLLAGADAVQIASTIYKNGFGVIKEMLAELETFMVQNDYAKILVFQGLMSQKYVKNPAMYERSQFMRYFSFEDHDIL